MTRARRRQQQPLTHPVASLERTALAWERTAVSLGAVGLLLLKVIEGGAATQVSGLLLVAAAILIALLVVPLGYGRARSRVDPADQAAPFTGHDDWRPWALISMAAVVSVSVVAVAVDFWLTGLR